MITDLVGCRARGDVVQLLGVERKAKANFHTRAECLRVAWNPLRQSEILHR